MMTDLERYDGLDRRDAEILMEKGELVAAEGLLCHLIDQAHADDALHEFHLYSSRSTVRQRAGKWEEALGDLDTAESVLAKLPAFVQGLSRKSILHARANIHANGYFAKRDPAVARTLLEALRETSEVEFTALDLRSRLESLVGNWHASATLALDAASMLDEFGSRAVAASLKQRAAEAFVEAGMLDQAEAVLAGCRDTVARIGTQSDRGKQALTEARVCSARGEHKRAWQFADEGLEITSLLIRKFSSLADQQRFLTDKLDQYAKAFRVALADESAAGLLNAWSVAERSKGFYLSQLIAADYPSLSEGTDPSWIDGLNELDAQLDALEKQRQQLGAEDHAKHEELVRQESSLSRKKQEKLATLMRDHADWGRVGVPQTVSIQQAFDDLPDGWTLLSYFWEPASQSTDSTDPALHIFWFDAAGLPRHVQKRWTEVQLAELRAARERLVGFVHPGVEMVSQRLSEMLIPREVRESLPQQVKVLVSPHGLLQQMPLHALPLDTAEGTYLVHAYSFQYLPTFTLLNTQSSRCMRSGEKRVRALGCEQDNFGSRPLVNTPLELVAIENAWKSSGHCVDRVLVSPEQSLKQAGIGPQHWGEYQVLHVACHGKFPAGRPYDAALYLGDTALRTSDWFLQPTSADVVVVSACAVGRQAQEQQDRAVVGDEWVGIYLPLLSAGVATVVASLWDVYAKAASPFMTMLHERLAQGVVPADAVRHAMLDRLNDKKDRVPAKWANWYVVGFPSGPFKEGETR